MKSFQIKNKLFSPYDLLIVIFIALVSVFFIIMNFNSSSKNTAVVRINGEIAEKVELYNLTDAYTKTVTGDKEVIFLFESDGVTAVSSDCEDKVCMHTGKIRHSGESIVCLPAKVTVTIESDSHNKDDIDAILR